MRRCHDGRAVDEIRAHFFDRPVSVDRICNCDGPDTIIITFDSGGRVEIFTDYPLVWIEPERH